MTKCTKEKKSDLSQDLVTLKEFFDVRLAQVEALVCEKFNTVETATSLAKEALDLRLQSMNKFRETLQDQAATFMTRTEYQLQHDRLIEDIRMLKEAKALMDGKASQSSVNIAYLLAFAGLLVSVINVIHSFWSK